MQQPQGSQDDSSDAIGESHEGGSALSDDELTSGELGPADLVARHQRGVWRYLRMLGCEAATADDLTQETFLKVLRRDNFVQHSDAATASYLRRTAYTLLVNAHRRSKRETTLADSLVMDEIWDRWAGKDLTGDLVIDRLRECMASLTERAQMALRMRFSDRASRSDIAKALEITDHGARNLMQRAKAQLRDCMESKSS